ncbi:MAG TPA: hypothetical protein VFW32_08465, partial [Actinomycetes bacterium]|nr:hypothetical protein [Actinomycetes bacterium]
EALARLVGEARDRQRQVARERRLLKELRAGLDGLPLVELPFLAGGVGGPGEVRALAAHLVPLEEATARDDRPPARRAAGAGSGGG